MSRTSPARAWELQQETAAALQRLNEAEFRAWQRAGAPETAIAPQWFHTHQLCKGLQVADTFVADQDALAFLDFAASSRQPEILEREDVPFGSGFVVFPEGGEAKGLRADFAGRLVEAFAWNTAQNATVRGRDGLSVVVFIRDPSEPAELWPSTFAAIPFGMPYAPPDTVEVERAQRKADAGRVPHVDAQAIVQAHADLAVFIEAFFALISQHALMATETAVPRASRRRANATPGTRALRIVHLPRRVIPGTSPGTAPAREWDHRWMVRGHWRNQWYPSEQRHKQIWIREFVKGPADQPLVTRKAVYVARKPSQD